MIDEERAIERLIHLLRHAEKAAKFGNIEVVVVLGGVRSQKGRRMRIAGKGSPLGEVVGWDRAGAVVMVPTMKLAAWCCARLMELGVAVDVEVAPPTEATP